MSNKILNKVNNYYSTKIIEKGISSAGVDWNSIDSHYLRFSQLTKIIDKDEPNKILDYGCGYGALIDYLKCNNFKNFEYFGFDISEEMIKRARQKFSEKRNHFATDIDKLNENTFDYCIANGIFNVKLEFSSTEWLDYIIKTLNTINSLTSKGFSFNILTKYSDKEFMKDYLYYADPLFFFDYCKTHFSKYVTLIHDYPLYEFSITVKK
ncbi:MAG: class I SAM-dependent methyltransferase [Flavobacteriaceae bacterium]